MQCSECGGQTQVLETRADAVQGVKRRRRCKKCGTRVTTVETVEQAVVVRKRAGALEAFDRRKVVSSISRASHTGRLAPADVNAAVERVERQVLLEAQKGPVPSARVGEILLDVLAELPPPADLIRIRFAMVFLGRSDRPAALSNAQEFLDWLDENYTLPKLDRDHLGQAPTWVTKRDGRHAQRFEVEKLSESIELALQDRGRPSEVGRMAFTIAGEIVESFADQPVISSIQLGAEVLRYLREEDALPTCDMVRRSSE